MCCAGRDDLANDSRLAGNSGRVEHENEIDDAISAWTSALTESEVLQALQQADVPSGPIYSVVDMFDDPHYKERGLFEEIDHVEGKLTVPAIHPKLSDTPGRTDSGGPELGAHNEEILRDLLGMESEQIEQLKSAQVI